jgi:hypothetical protein
MRRLAAIAAWSFVLTLASHTVHAADNFDFGSYPSGGTYKGKLKLPDFKARDKVFASFKTRITEAMKEGVSFAGEYSVAQFGCGSGCTNVVVANNRTGQLYPFPRGGEYNQALELEYRVDSNLMLARWFTDSLWETCVIESFLFDGGQWIAKEAMAGRGDAQCSGSIAEAAQGARGL